MPDCTYDGADDYDSTEPTIDGGSFPFKASDSLGCRAWKLAATICNSEPKPYSSTFLDTSKSLWNFQCESSGGFRERRFGAFCQVSEQFICTPAQAADAACAFVHTRGLVVLPERWLTPNPQCV